ncbi:MAG TPA: efflux RND transporter permease subunit, partial [Myxococcaceae bacterium]|nr:efflux RND transporter permease subunit [Myxococcaceae bacterium]
MSVTPALTLILLRRAPLSESASPFAEGLRHLYRALFGWATGNPRLAFAAVCAALVLGLLSLPFLRQESLLPTFKETDLVVRWEGGPSASHPAMSRITTLASRELRAIPGVRNVSAQIGRAIVSDRRTNINSGEVWVSIDQKADYERTVAAVKEVVAGYPGLSPEVLTYLQTRMREELSGSSEPLVVRVYGWDMDVLRQKAEEVNKLLGRIDGIFGSRVQYPDEMPTLEIQVDVDKAQRHGLKPGDVRRAATTLVSGIEVGNLFDEQKVFEVMVYGTPEARHSLTGIQELLIDAPRHRHVRLKDVAEVQIRPSPTEIRRDAAARRLDVTANVRGRDLAAVAADVRHGLREISFPLEYHAELRGEYAERLAAQQRVLRFAIAAAVGILLVLQAFFRSWRLAAVVFLILPVGLVGGVWAAFLSGGLLSFGSIVALVALLGISVRNATVLTDRYRRLEQEGGQAPLAEAVQRGTEERSAPILMTAITTALAFLPLALFGDIAGLEIARPIAFTILGGLVSTTLLALVGVPAIYLLFGRAREAEFEELTPPAAPEQAMQQVAVKP